MIAAIVLAAGASARMGRPKLTLAMPDGRALVRVAVEQVLAAALDDVVVVLGGEADAVRAALGGLPVREVVNPRYAEGQSTSLRAGLDALRPGTTAALIALGDQPLPDPTRDRAPRRGASDDGPADRRASLPRRAGEPRPVRGLALRRAPCRDRGSGGRHVVARDARRVAEVPVDAPMPADVDTPEDYEAARKAWQPRA